MQDPKLFQKNFGPPPASPRQKFHKFYKLLTREFRQKSIGEDFKLLMGSTRYINGGGVENIKSN